MRGKIPNKSKEDKRRGKQKMQQRLSVYSNNGLGNEKTNINIAAEGI